MHVPRRGSHVIGLMALTWLDSLSFMELQTLELLVDRLPITITHVLSELLDYSSVDLFHSFPTCCEACRQHRAATFAKPTRLLLDVVKSFTPAPYANHVATAPRSVKSRIGQPVVTSRSAAR